VNTESNRAQIISDLFFSLASINGPATDLYINWIELLSSQMYEYRSHVNSIGENEQLVSEQLFQATHQYVANNYRSTPSE